jgi:hypothetical protein
VKFSYRADGAHVVLRLEQRGVTAPLPITVRLQYRSGKIEHILVQADGPVTEHRVPLTEPLRSATANGDYQALAIMDR